jgi:acyl-CoA dehydrogenase
MTFHKHLRDTIDYVVRANILDQVERFVEEECVPADAVYAQQIGSGTVKERFDAHPQVIEDLKVRAKELGLWNMFLPKNHFKEGAGFSNLEYGLMAEYLGKSGVASEVCLSGVLM